MHKRSTLILVDFQNDFMPGGALGVKNGNEIVKPTNQVISNFDEVVFTLDWHPQNHISFASTWNKNQGEVVLAPHDVKQVLWPDHCIENTFGSCLVEDVNQNMPHKVFYKGARSDLDSYSIFFDQQGHVASEIDGYLKSKEVKTLFIAGLATEYCILFSALDAISLGYEVYVLIDCCKPVNLDPDDEKNALALMKEKGVQLITSNQVADFISLV